MNKHLWIGLSLLAWNCSLSTALSQEIRVTLTPDMVVNERERGNPEAMIDEQDKIGDPPTGQPESTWKINSKHWKTFPYGAYLDLGHGRKLSSLWIFDTFNHGELIVHAGTPGNWKEVLRHDTMKYMSWTQLKLDVSTRFLRIERATPSCIFSEIALYEYTPEAYRAMIARKAAEQEERAARDVALAQARAEEANRPLVDMGPLFGKLRLVEEVNCAAEPVAKRFRQDPPQASRVETILGRPCRVLKKTEGEAAYFAYRLGKWKLLKPGAAYVLAVEYPEDQPRSWIVMNGGNEISRGLHTGTTFGDAFEPKYVNNNNESLHVPLSGKYENWKLFFHLHDRFPDFKFLRGAGPRALTADDGFWVTVGQFSANNIPASHGAAVSRIRLFEVPDPARLYCQLRLPPDDLPQRHLFWREEMADGVIAAKKEDERGLKEPLDWYRYKVSTMRFLGMNTFSKDLLEFGACQGWDSSPGGGNKWVYFNSDHKDLWAGIVEMMGKHDFNVLPYYEYSGSKGQNGLGNQRRAKPLTRDDAYTHITWIENSNADVTDPDTYEDFKRMLDLTVVRFQDKARFVGAWLRPRSQLPLGFGDATRARFAEEANDGNAVTRAQLIEDRELLHRYYDWWYGKRRDFLVAMRDHLRNSGVADAAILYTADPSEPGTSFPTYEKQFVTDDVARWQSLLAREESEVAPIALSEVLLRKRYLEALLAPRPDWGGWEVGHSSPPSDPSRYKKIDGVLMTHCFNRAYTVGSPTTFDTFRGSAGLALVRHYALNENMMFDKNDKEKVGYFVVDVERAGPYCMLAEARAMASGDPSYIGYLVGNNFGRGFPEYARAFNQAFLALPALPSKVLEDVASDPEIVVRSIDARQHGTYLAVINPSLTSKSEVTVEVAVGSGTVLDATTGDPLPHNHGRITLSMDPCQLRSLQLVK